ncbi:MAG TPA: acetylglutamate kinase [Candidatus Kryptonia bacterium]
MKIVLKIGGNEIDDSAFVRKVTLLARKIHSRGHRLVIVHGGGKEVTAALKNLGKESKFVDGFRYTDETDLGVIEMVLSGSVNKRLVRSLQSEGVNALGLSGVDGGMLTAKRVMRNGKDVGFVGEITVVNTAVLNLLLENFVIVISPISMDHDMNGLLNVNADYAAAAVASAISSDLAIFLSNVPGVMKNGTLLQSIDAIEFERLKLDGTIGGGMVPKVESAMSALKNGVRLAYVTDVEGADAMVSGREAGTRVNI